MGTPLKSLTTFLQEYVENLFADISYVYTRSSHMRRDKTRLMHELEVHGSRIVTLDLPSIGKAFDKALSEGFVNFCDLPFSRSVSKRVKVPAFLSDLFLQVFHTDGSLREAPSIEAISCLRTLLLGAKKLRLPYTERSYENEVSNFISIEQDMEQPTLNWGRTDLLSTDASDDCFGGNTVNASSTTADATSRDIPRLGYENILKRSRMYQHCGSEPVNPVQFYNDYVGQVADIVAAQFGDFDSEEPNELPKHGPGVTSDGKRFENKYSFRRWPRKLDAIFPFDYYAVHNSVVAIDSGFEYEEEEIPSRLIAVPKTQKGPRLIAAEPVEHQWIQQLIRSQLENRLSRTSISDSISFRDQSRNGRAALAGSKDQSVATIDLSSASDRLSCYVIERIFRANFSLLRRLNASRTSSTTYRTKTSAGVIHLRKFASMGSAVTFPVQSIVYTILAVATVLYLEKRRPTSSSIAMASRQVLVFGDDIIVPTRVSCILMSVLADMGLKINTDKTFAKGFFRESCGVDAYDGVDLTPPYLLNYRKQGSALSAYSWIEVSNNFFQRGYWNVAKWLDSKITKFDGLIPITRVGEASSLARLSYSGSDRSHLKQRWNPLHQLYEYRVLTMHRKVISEDTSDASRLLKWFIEKPLPCLKWTGKTDVSQVVTSRPGWHSYL